MKKALLAALLATVATPALAVGPIDQVSSTFAQFPTYSASTTFTPQVGAGDFLKIVGSATKSVKIGRLECYITGTAAAVTIQAIVRSTADTGGTASTAPVVVKHDSTDAAATATFGGYTAAPTAGTAVGPVRSAIVVEAASGTAPVATFSLGFGTEENKGVYLRGATQSLVLANVGSFGAGTSVTCNAEWTEQ